MRFDAPLSVNLRLREPEHNQSPDWGYLEG